MVINNRPRISFGELPLSERTPTFELYGLLSELKVFAEKYGHCLELLLRSEREYVEFSNSINELNKENSLGEEVEQLYIERRMRGAWSALAHDQAAISLEDFRIILMSINVDKIKHGVIWPFVDRPAIEHARERFIQTFPNAEKVRNASAHQADMMINSRERRENSITDEVRINGIAKVAGSRIQLIGVLGADGLTNTMKPRKAHAAELVVSTLSREGLHALHSIVNIVFGAFAAAEPGVSDLMSRKRRANEIMDQLTGTSGREWVP